MRPRPVNCRYGPQGREPFIAANPSAPSSTRNAFMRPDMPNLLSDLGLPQASNEAPVAICRQEVFRHPLTQADKPAKIRPRRRERASDWTRVNRPAPAAAEARTRILPARSLVARRVVKVTSHFDAAAAREVEVLKRNRVVQARDDVHSLESHKGLDASAREDLAISVHASAVGHGRADERRERAGWRNRPRGAIRGSSRAWRRGRPVRFRDR